MKLKLKRVHIESPEIIAIMNSKTAKSLDIHAGDRIAVGYNGKSISSDVDTTDSLVGLRELAISREGLISLGAKNGDLAKIALNHRPRSLPYIMKKLDGHILSKDEIFAIIREIVDNSLNEVEIAYFVSGVYEKGMTLEETVNLTEAIYKTGRTLSWNGKKIADKHSIGGIAGNRTTPIVVSICAAAGIILPKTSSRSISSAAGTADTMEVITKVDFSAGDLRKIVSKVGACLAWGGSLGLAPADDKLIRVERLLNLDPDSQLIASILAKKLSVGSKYVLIDIPYGEGAKVSKIEALSLKKKFLSVGKRFGLKIKVVLTNGEEPIGNGIGPVLEIIDIIKVLKRQSPPIDLENKSVKLAGILLEMLGKAEKGKGEKEARQILNSGAAYKKFEEILQAQGRKKITLEPGKFSKDIVADRRGVIKRVDNKLINSLGKVLGCPADKGAGIYLYKHCKDKVNKGEKIMTLYSNSKINMDEALFFYNKFRPILINNN
ncbi:MAG: thymidine phosphorylase family protein [Nanoarchaeota archaeon]|nr:thymidine phosphorylase family protein [Nanoarchaeota archaeon]